MSLVEEMSREQEWQEQCARNRYAVVEWTNHLGMRFRFMPQGTFVMGTPVSEAGRSAGEVEHSVTLSNPRYLSMFQTTQQQYERVMGTNPACFQGFMGTASYNFRTEHHPVECVSWFDAMEFCRRLSALPEAVQRGLVYRLPTEAEWEHACRCGGLAGSQTNHVDGELPDLWYQGWYADNSSRMTHPVGLQKRNHWGLYDMRGNVCEWCLDWFFAYPRRSVTDPRGPATGRRRVVRGGCWDDAASACRAGSRNRFVPDLRCPGIGFRVVLEGFPKQSPSLADDFL